MLYGRLITLSANVLLKRINPGPASWDTTCFFLRTDVKCRSFETVEIASQIFGPWHIFLARYSIRLSFGNKIRSGGCVGPVSRCCGGYITSFWRCCLAAPPYHYIIWIPVQHGLPPNKPIRHIDPSQDRCVHHPPKPFFFPFCLPTLKCESILMSVKEIYRRFLLPFSRARP